MRVRLEQRRGRHELARLAVAALRDVELAPGLLQRVFSGRIEAFYCCHGFAADRRDRRLACALGGAVEVNRACAALADPASVLRADETQRVAKHPQHRRVGCDVDGVGFAVDVQRVFAHSGDGPVGCEVTGLQLLNAWMVGAISQAATRLLGRWLLGHFGWRAVAE
jgi:hypothetical protein